MKRQLLGAVLAAASLLCGCAATNFDGDTIKGIDALLAPAADTAAAIPAGDDPAAGLPALDPGSPAPAYAIGPNDVLTVLVWGRPDLGSQVPANSNNRRQVTTVDSRGEIYLPFLDPVPVAGLTLQEAARRISDAYAAVVSSPQVHVEMVENRARPVNVSGMVNAPRTVYLADNIRTVSEVLGAAGGYNGQADVSRVVLSRGDRTYELNIWESAHGRSRHLDLLLQEGDHLFVPEARDDFFYVFGDVNSQGAFPLTSRGTSLLEGLAKAGGLNPETSSRKNLLLFRRAASDSAVYEFKYFDALQRGDVPLLPGDRIHVEQNFVTKVGHTLRNTLPILSIISSVWIVDRIINEP